MIRDFTLLSLSTFLLILLLRRRVDRHEKLTNHREWCKRELRGERRKVGELFQTNNETHHIT